MLVLEKGKIVESGNHEELSQRFTCPPHIIAVWGLAVYRLGIDLGGTKLNVHLTLG